MEWTSDLVTPKSLWLPGVFNPTAYLTAVMQATARKNTLPLDKMTVETHITMMMSPDEVEDYAEDGAFCHGIFIEGAGWPDVKDEDADVQEALETYTVGSTPCGGYVKESKLKELLPMMPLVYVKAVVVQPEWEPTSVGYLRHNEKVYECPVYLTTFRGPTYVFLATLRSQHATSKWVLAAVAMIFQDDE
jgi:dynein heavy chain